MACRSDQPEGKRGKADGRDIGQQVAGFQKETGHDQHEQRSEDRGCVGKHAAGEEIRTGDQGRHADDRERVIRGFGIAKNLDQHGCRDNQTQAERAVVDGKRLLEERRRVLKIFQLVAEHGRIEKIELKNNGGGRKEQQQDPIQPFFEHTDILARREKG